MSDKLNNKPEPFEFLLYQTEEGQTRLEVAFRGETCWLSLNQLAELFQRDKSVISRHIKNLFDEGELVQESVVANFATTAADGKSYQVDYFNLDVIAAKENMGLIHWIGDKPSKSEAVIAKNYLKSN